MSMEWRKNWKSEVNLKVIKMVDTLGANTFSVGKKQLCPYQ